MKVECLREKVRIGIGLVEKLTGKNLSLPVLSAILLEATDKDLVLRGTNLEVGIEYKIPARVEKKGKAVVQGSLIHTFFSQVRGGDHVTLEKINNNLLAATKHNTTLLKCLSIEDFPTLPRPKTDIVVSMRADKLVEGLRAAWYAASISDIKPEIASVYITQKEDEIVFVATDSFRLAEKRVENDGRQQFPSVLIPHKNCVELIRVLEGLGGSVDVLFDRNQLSLTCEHVYFTTRLVAGSFPNYEQIMPVSHKTSVTVLKEDFASALKLANIFSDKLNQVTLRVIPVDGVFEVESRNQDTGESTTKVDAVLEGEQIELAFNAKYILEAFQSIEGDSLILYFNGDGKPLMLRSIGRDGFTYLVMPMNR